MTWHASGLLTGSQTVHVHVQDPVGQDVLMEELGALFTDKTELSMAGQEAALTINELQKSLEECSNEMAGFPALLFLLSSLSIQVLLHFCSINSQPSS